MRILACRCYFKRKGICRFVHSISAFRFANPSFVRLGSELGISEMVLSGTTTFCDMYFHSDETKQVALKTGIRIACGEPLIDFGDGK